MHRRGLHAGTGSKINRFPKLDSEMINILISHLLPWGLGTGFYIGNYVGGSLTTTTDAKRYFLETPA
jgi:hypothetical protein